MPQACLWTSWPGFAVWLRCRPRGSRYCCPPKNPRIACGHHLWIKKGSLVVASNGTWWLKNQTGILVSPIWMLNHEFIVKLSMTTDNMFSFFLFFQAWTYIWLTFGSHLFFRLRAIQLRLIEQHTGISIQQAIEKGFPAYAERAGAAKGVFFPQRMVMYVMFCWVKQTPGFFGKNLDWCVIISFQFFVIFCCNCSICVEAEVILFLWKFQIWSMFVSVFQRPGVHELLAKLKRCALTKPIPRAPGQLALKSMASFLYNELITGCKARSIMSCGRWFLKLDLAYLFCKFVF